MTSDDGDTMSDKVEVDRADLEALLASWHKPTGRAQWLHATVAAEAFRELLKSPSRPPRPAYDPVVMDSWGRRKYPKEHDRLVSERDLWKRAALDFMSIAADNVMRLRMGMSYMEAQRRYDETLKVYEKAVALGKSEDRA